MLLYISSCFFHYTFSTFFCYFLKEVLFSKMWSSDENFCMWNKFFVLYTIQFIWSKLIHPTNLKKIWLEGEIVILTKLKGKKFQQWPLFTIVYNNRQTIETKFLNFTNMARIRLPYRLSFLQFYDFLEISSSFKIKILTLFGTIWQIVRQILCKVFVCINRVRF